MFIVGATKGLMAHGIFGDRGIEGLVNDQGVIVMVSNKLLSGSG